MKTFLMLALLAASAHCDFNCKIRITACAGNSLCVTDDVLPEQTGLCPIMMMGVIGEWIAKHPNMTFKSAECVPPDDNKI